jgi:hypothetical protein
MRSYLSLGFLLFAASAILGCGADVQTLFSGGNAGGGGQGGSGGAGGQGGAGQGGQGGATVSSNSAAQGTGPASASSSASGQGGSGGGFDPQACGQCAFANCQTELFTCGTACQPFATCAQNCADKPCIDDCLTQYPQAQPVYDCTCASCAPDCGSYCGGGSGSSTSASSTAVSSSSSTGGGACSTCSETLNGGMNPPCPGSDQLLGALFQCTCQQSCTIPCGTSCQGGGQPSTQCLGCVQSNCGTQLNACLQD